MLADLLPLVQEWRPELVVNDAAELAGPIVAALAGVPNATKSFGALIPGTRVAAAGETVAPLWTSVGLAPRPYAGCYDHLYLDVYPPVLQPELPAHVGRRQLLRPVPYDTDGSGTGEPPLPGGDPGRPLVYVTMGTVFNSAGVLREPVEALARLPVRLLVTVGPDGDPAALGGQPAHVLVERYVPQTQVLAHADAVVSHGGSGTVLATLALGIPQLCLPKGADQFANAAAVVRAGAGLALAPADATGVAIAEAVSRLFDEGAFAEAATGVAGAIAAMPGPDEVAIALERLP
jgi:UDP:flavonoid glycosyltransferase YjiC (YdhE family)